MSIDSTQPVEAQASADAVRRVISTATAPERPGALSNCLAFGWRGMRKIRHVPEQLLDVTVTPVMFLLMFTYLFGGAISGSTEDYLQYILPGLLVQSVLFTTVYSGMSLNTDMTKGVVDRFRSLPIWRPAPLAGAVLGDSVRYAVAGSVVIVLGIVLGFDAEGGLGGILLALGLVVVFAFALSWLFTCLGLVMRSPNAVMNTGFMALFPLIFLSNIFVEPDTLPAVLEAFVNANPISFLVTATRDLMAGEFPSGDIAIVLGSAAAMTAVFAPLTVRLYGSRG